MNRHSKAKAVARSTAREACYQTAWLAGLLALMAALLLAGHGMARAADLPQAQTAQPAPDAAPEGLGCTDDMDFSPEDNLPSPFDADDVAFHPARARPFAVLGVVLPVDTNDSCQEPSQRVESA